MLKTKPRKMPEVSTASLPDIVFMLLFFFMVTTVMQDEKPKVKVLRPTAQEVEKIEERDLCATILVGYTDDNNVPQIQADDQMIEVNQVGRFIQEKRSNLPESLSPKFITIIKADKDLPMEIITQIKEELKKVQAFKIQYATKQLVNGS
jgi:biopolymer transport protein ExbD